MVEGDFNIDGIYGVGIGTQLTDADQQKMYSKWKIVHIINIKQNVYFIFIIYNLGVGLYYYLELIYLK
jgi:hypothetical protein